MVKYRKFQFGWVIVIIFLILIILMTYGYFYQWGTNPLDTPGYIFFMVLFGGLLLGFYGMTVIVTDKQIKIKLGIGLYTKKIDLSAISSVNTLTYPFYCGFGIRIVSNGLLFNVSGKHAVEIKFKNTKNVILIGSADWEKLRDIIEKCIGKNVVS
jgi:peptidoglycan/LPS O-acetylase OafA/YrhL